MGSNEYHGILCVDKPAGFTSFDVIAKLRGILRQRKMGHAGTLDPMATGVLPVFLGAATRAIDLVPVQDKGYTAGFTLGLSTDTYDSTGQIQQTAPVRVGRQEIEAALSGFRGQIEQLPPMYSAVKVNGQKLYQLARQGKTIEREPRRVIVYDLQLLDYDEATCQGTLHIFCSKGTYVRSIVHDLGQLLGCGGVMHTLRRWSALDYDLDECMTLDQIESKSVDGTLQLRPVDSCFAQWDAVQLSEELTRLYINGVRFSPRRLLHAPQDNRKLRVYGCNGQFLGLAYSQWDEDQFRAVRTFHTGLNCNSTAI